MFSYTAIVGSGDGGRAGSWHAHAGTCVQIVRGEKNCWEDGNEEGDDSCW